MPYCILYHPEIYVREPAGGELSGSGGLQAADRGAPDRQGLKVIGPLGAVTRDN